MDTVVGIGQPPSLISYGEPSGAKRRAQSAKHKAQREEDQKVRRAENQRIRR